MAGPLRSTPAAGDAILEASAFRRLEALAEHGEPMELRRGEVLVRQGEPSDALYFVVSGRFSVHVDEAGSPIAEIGQGQPIGEVGFFTGLPRTATVVALRDSSVLAFTREQFDRAGESLAAIREAVIVALARRLSHNNRPLRARAALRTVAVLPAGGSVVPPAFAERLRGVVGAANRTAFVSAADVEARFSGRAPDDPVVSDWLNSLEAGFDLVFYVADHEATDWTRKCVRQVMPSCSSRPPGRRSSSTPASGSRSPSIPSRRAAWSCSIASAASRYRVPAPGSTPGTC